MKFKSMYVLGLVLVAPLSAVGDDDLDQLQDLVQGQFRGLSEDLGAALSYKPLIPAEPLGITGFDIGLAVTGTQIENDAAFDIASNDDFSSTLPAPSIRVHKGLPLGIDVGAMYSAMPGSNIKLWGGEVRYAIVKGNVALPAVAIRGAYTKLTGVDQLDFDTKSVDVSVSKGFTVFTPYAGVGKVWVTSTPDGSTGLAEESPSLTKLFVGTNINFGLLNLDFEVDRTGDANSYGAKVGWRF